MIQQKRRKLSKQPQADTSSDQESLVGADEFESDARSDSGNGGSSSPDTENEIAGALRQKSKQTQKRKRRATEPSRFGATLQTLLDTETPSGLPLSLKPSVARKKNDEKLELKAKMVLLVEKKEMEEKGRITDIIGGWGGESERTLRKVAQRGVVKLFNVIQQTQVAAQAEQEEAKANRGTGKPSLPAPPTTHKSKGKKKGKDQDNIIGRGKEATVQKDNFFDMIRSGGLVSKT